jgi:short-subunit dehydrogenase
MTAPPLAFITGASSGIGQALALRFYQGGYSLALVARRTAEIERWRDAQGLDTTRVGIYQADVAQPETIMDVGLASIERQGLADVVIANAGVSIGIDTAIREDIAVMARILAINNVGMAATFQPFIAPMRARKSGTLVGIGSVAGIRGLPGHGGYCASKAGVIGYCESLRGELRADGVCVVTLCPGYIDTPLTRRNTYGMPFLMSAERFADKALASIEAGASYRVIPWQMGVVAKLMRVLPNAVFDRLLVGRARKPRNVEG